MGKMLWNKEEEYKFFKRTLEIASPEQLFYLTDDGRFLAYWPKNYKGKRTTLQSRNTFIGKYTEKWVRDLLQDFAKELNFYAVNDVICEEIDITDKSPIDVAITKTPHNVQKPQNILLIVEVKMSIVWNWEYDPKTGEIKCIGDYKTHSGNPSLLRSDTMLKAIGKSINIRVSGFKSARIPIIVAGNTPITKTYYKKVDFLKKAGIVQGFFSLNPNPLDNPSGDNIKKTPEGGFLRIDNDSELFGTLKNLLENDKEFFSSMISKRELGRIIEIANEEPTYEKKAERFLELLRGI